MPRRRAVGRNVLRKEAAGEIAEVRYNFDRTGFTIVDRVRHVAEPIVLPADSDRTRLAAAEVAVTYRETTPNFDPERSTCRSS